MGDRAGALDGPELEAEIGVVAHHRAGLFRGMDRREDRVGAGFRDRLADARHVQDARFTDKIGGDFGWRHPARGRAFRQ